jgi:hypothetical protein
MAKIQHKCNSKKRNDSQCRNNNWCPVCRRDRTYNDRRRAWLRMTS